MTTVMSINIVIYFMFCLKPLVCFQFFRRSYLTNSGFIVFFEMCSNKKKLFATFSLCLRVRVKLVVMIVPAFVIMTQSPPAVLCSADFLITKCHIYPVAVPSITLDFPL